MLVLLMGGIYEVRPQNSSMCHDVLNKVSRKMVEAFKKYKGLATEFESSYY
jgi:hypothetical protein